MSRRAQENIVVVVFLAVFIGVIVLSLDFGPRARMIPLPLAVFGIVLALIQLVWQNFGSTDALKMDMIRVDKPAGTQVEPEAEASRAGQTAAQKPSLRKRAGAYGIVAGLLGMVLAFGPVPAVFVFTLGFFLVTRYYTPMLAFVYASVFTAAIHLLFFVVLEVNPYHGLLAPLIARFE
jgi:Tripartite tricarboxylate transporter TctB family